MKAYLALISAAVIGLAACSQEAAKPAEAPAASAASEAAPAETTAPAEAIVIGKAEDMDGIFKDGAGAAATDYVKPDDARVVAHTKLVGGGEESSLTLDPAKLAGGEYKFACTFPGHGALMNGKVTLVD